MKNGDYNQGIKNGHVVESETRFGPVVAVVLRDGEMLGIYHPISGTYLSSIQLDVNLRRNSVYDNKPKLHEVVNLMGERIQSHLIRLVNSSDAYRNFARM